MLYEVSGARDKEMHKSSVSKHFAVIEKCKGDEAFLVYSKMTKHVTPELVKHE